MKYNERIKELRKALNLTLEKFGKKLGVGKSAINKIEKDENSLTEQMFKSVCREFNVNPEWPRNGTGDMFLESKQDDMIAGWVGRVLRDEPESFRKNVIAVMSTWANEDWNWIEKFDVHSFIFSEDAVALENKIHEQLTDKRVNKVNLRKEFFKISLDELENLVNEIDPTAEFNRTMIASKYRASPVTINRI